MRQVLEITALAHYPDEIGRWLWALETARRQTVRMVAGVDQATLDWQGPDGLDNAIGSLLYHIGRIEMNWLFLDVLARALPPVVAADFPLEAGSPGSGLVRVLGVPLAEHLARLERSRGLLLQTFRHMTLDDWRRPRRPGDADYEVTPEWAVFHLVEHEAGHAYQISSIKRRAARLLA